MNWIDVVVIIILLGSVINGWRKGLINSVIGLVKWIIGLIVANQFYHEVAVYVTENFWNPIPTWSEHITGWLTSSINIDMTQSDLTQSDMSSVISGIDLPEIYRTQLSQRLNEIQSTSAIDFMNTLGNLVSQMLFNALVFLVLLFVTMGLVALIGAIINQVTKLPILNELNRGGGVIVGGLIGLISVYVLMMIVHILYPFEFMTSIVKAINQSEFGIYFYKYNILENLLDGLLAKIGFLV